MTMSAKRTLKVFQARLGFYDTVVAAPSQAAALRAWGVHQNLFHYGEAQPATDETAIAAARAHPGTPLRRAAGSDGPFKLQPAPPKSAQTSRGSGKLSAKGAAKSASIPPDRSRLEAAETALRKLEAERQRETAGLRRRQEVLDAEAARAATAYQKAHKTAAAAITKARAAYSRAGGDC
jgi:hypothetical protein